MVSFYEDILLAESQKGVNAVQWCSIENQKGADSIEFAQWWCSSSFPTENPSRSHVNLGEIPLQAFENNFFLNQGCSQNMSTLSSWGSAGGVTT